MNIRKYPKAYKDSALFKFIFLLLTADTVNDALTLAKVIFTEKERLAVGRRIEIANLLNKGLSNREIKSELKTSEKTITYVADRLLDYSDIFDLISNKEADLYKRYKNKKWGYKSGSMGVKIFIGDTNFNFKNLKR